MLKRIGLYIARYWYLHLLVLALSLTAAAIGIVQPWLFERLVDDVLVGGERHLLLVLLIGYAFAHVVGLALEIARHYYSVLEGNRAVVDLRNDLVRHLRRLSLRFFYREETGRIMAVMSNDAPAMERLFQSLLPTILLDVSYLIGLAYIIIERSGHAALTITAFLMIPFYIFFPAVISRTFRQAFRRVQESHGLASFPLEPHVDVTGWYM